MANSLIGVLQQLKAAGGKRVGFDYSMMPITSNQGASGGP